MSLKAEVTLEWADGEYLFALKSAQIEELQKVCGNVGFGVIYQRVMLGTWFIGDLKNTIRLALIGGGMGAVEAKRLTEAYAQPPFVAGPNNPESLVRAILKASMVGMEDLDPPGEQMAGKDPAGSTSPNTEQVFSPGA